MVRPVQFGIPHMPGAPQGLPPGIPIPTYITEVHTPSEPPPPAVPGQGLKRGITYLADYGGCGFYRCIGPDLLLNLHEKAVIAQSTAMILDPRFYGTVQTVKFQRQATVAQKEFIKLIKEVAKQTKTKIMYEVDDVVFHEDIPMYNRNRDAFTDPAIRENIMEILGMMDEITVTCDYFRDYMIEKSGNKNVTTVPNYLMKWWFDRSYNLGALVKKFDQNKKKPIVACFASGTHVDVLNRVNQKDDFEAVVPHIIKTRTEIDWRFYGSYPLPLKPFIDAGQIKFFPWTKLPDFPEAVANSGAQLTFAALQDNHFNKSKCVTGDTMIQIKDIGMISIKDHCESTLGDKGSSAQIMSKGQFEETNAFYVSPKTEKIVSIRTKMGYHIKGTHTHKLLVGDKWKEMGQIIPGDVVEISKYNLQDNLPYQELKLPFWQTKKISTDSFNAIQDKDISPYIKVNESFARLFGYALGDGHFSSGNAVGFTCNNRDPEVIEDIQNLIRQMGIEPKVFQSTKKTDCGATTIYCCSRTLRRMFEWMGMTAKRQSKTLSVPPFIWKSKKSVVCNFLTGLFEADATVASCSVEFCTKSKRLAEDIQILLLGLGVSCKISEQISRYTKKELKNGKKDVVYTGVHYIVRMLREGTDVFCKEVPFVSTFKQDRVHNMSTKKHSNAYQIFDWKDEIIKVEELEAETVYDVCVPSNHCYTANGIVSHNSNIKQLEAAALGIPCVCPDMVTYKDALLKYSNGNEFIDCIKTATKNQTVYADYCKRSRAYAENFWLDDEPNLMKHYEAMFTPFGSPERVYLK